MHDIDSKSVFIQLVCCTHVHTFNYNFDTTQMRTQPVSWRQLAPDKNQETRTDFTSDYNNMPCEGIKTASKRKKQNKTKHTQLNILV